MSKSLVYLARHLIILVIIILSQPSLDKRRPSSLNGLNKLFSAKSIGPSVFDVQPFDLLYNTRKCFDQSLVYISCC